MRSWMLASALLLVSACADNADPTGAKNLYTTVKSGAGYRSWQRAPGFPGRKASFTEHGDSVEIFVSPEISGVLAGRNAVSAWPVGATIVKESYSADTLSALAMMNKRADGTWFWAEYSADGNATSSGKPDVCIGCHDNRKVFSDWVYSFEFPK